MSLFYHSLSLQIEVEDDLDDIELVEVDEDSGNEEDDQLGEAGGVVTFQPLRDDSFACFRGHQGTQQHYLCNSKVISQHLYSKI